MTKFGIAVLSIAAVILATLLFQSVEDRHATARVAERVATFAAFDSGDYASALPRLRQLADEGYAVAQHRLSLILENGLGTDADPAAAARMYAAAAEQGVTDAAFRFALMLDEGRGVEPDPSRAGGY